MLDNYAEETQPLFKLLRTEAFRFVIVRYNHYSFVEQLEKDLKRLFPNRPIKKVDAQKLDYTRITNAYFSLNRGFFFIKNFDDVLKEERDSLNVETPQYAAQNERRRHITAGLNLRRDKLAKFPIALFVFVPASTGELYAKIIMEKMPDLWSFRSYILDLEKDITLGRNFTNEVSKIGSDFQLSEIIVHANPNQLTELYRLLALLEKTPKNEIAYKLTLFPQITDAAIEAGAYERALIIIDEWEKNANESDKGIIWIKKGDVFITIGNIDKAIILFEKAFNYFEMKGDKANISVCLERLGSTYAALGNLDKALSFYEDYNRLKQELYSANPTNVDFKKDLANSYGHLGITHTSLGNLDKAMEFYEETNKIFKELYTAYSNNVDFKNGLAVSYEKLGQTHIALGNLEKALGFYEDETVLFEELYAAYPTNVEFKKGLAISYQFLGYMHTVLGNLNIALGFYEEYNRLNKELYAAYPTNVSFKYGLSISYSKLGEIYSALGDLDKALALNEKANSMIKELNLTFSNNVEFKDNLAESLCDLGKFSRDKLLDRVKAKGYFKQAESLWIELVRDAPKFVEFQKSLVQVQKVLEDL